MAVSFIFPQGPQSNRLLYKHRHQAVLVCAVAKLTILVQTPALDIVYAGHA